MFHSYPSSTYVVKYCIPESNLLCSLFSHNSFSCCFSPQQSALKYHLPCTTYKAACIALVAGAVATHKFSGCTPGVHQPLLYRFFLSITRRRQQWKAPCVPEGKQGSLPMLCRPRSTGGQTILFCLYTTGQYINGREWTCGVFSFLNSAQQDHPSGGLQAVGAVWHLEVDGSHMVS